MTSLMPLRSESNSKIKINFDGGDLSSDAIRLKVNGTLTKLAESLEKELDEMTADNKVDYAVVYGEFRYAAASWGQTRRVIVKIEKPVNQLVYRLLL